MESPVNNRAFIYNSIVAYVVGKLCNVDVDNIKNGISNLNLTGNRLEYKKYRDNIILIDDSYNASLDSIKSSLEILRKEKAVRRIAVIGDVLELGVYSRELHIEIGMELLNSKLDYVVTIGEYTKYVDGYLRENNFNNVMHSDNESDNVINVIYTKYINNLKFDVVKETIYPFDLNKGKTDM